MFFFEFFIDRFFRFCSCFLNFFEIVQSQFQLFKKLFNDDFFDDNIIDSIIEQFLIKIIMFIVFILRLSTIFKFFFTLVNVTSLNFY